MTDKIREQILAVRKTGRTNMFDVPMVQYIANEMRFYELVIFLEEHRSEYVNFILTGESYDQGFRRCSYAAAVLPYYHGRQRHQVHLL